MDDYLGNKAAMVAALDRIASTFRPKRFATRQEHSLSYFSAEQAPIKSSRVVRSLGIFGVALFVVACGSVSTSGYIARLSPPSPDQFNSPVEFAKAYTGGADFTSPDGIRSTRTRMCGVAFGASRKALYLKGVGSICARQGGFFEAPLCLNKSDDTVIFAAVAQDTPATERLCNRELEDFYVVAEEPASTVNQAEFAVLMERRGFRSTAKILAAAERQRAIAAEEQNRRNAMATDLRNRFMARVAEFRRSIKVGDKSNCGPVIELRQNLAKVYRPVENYGTEHWLEVSTLFPEGEGCSFNNGQYQPQR